MVLFSSVFYLSNVERWNPFRMRLLLFKKFGYGYCIDERIRVSAPEAENTQRRENLWQKSFALYVGILLPESWV